MNSQIKQSIITHATLAPNEEICGLIYHTDREIFIYPCENKATDVATSFEIDPQDYITVAQLGKAVGVYHSHPHGATTFSPEDLAVASELCLPFYLYAIETDEWASYIPPTYIVNPVGLNFIWGCWDCLEVVRLYYRQNKQVYMTDYDRDETFQSAEADAITKHISDEGFYEVPGKGPIKVDDVLLFKSFGTAYPHHLGVFIGQNRILHHPLGKLSRVDPIDGAWLKRLSMVLRYGGKAK